MMVPSDSIIFLIWGLFMYFTSGEPILKDLPGKGGKMEGKGGFYGFRYGSLYKAEDFMDNPPPSQNVQVPVGVAPLHKQNSDEIKTGLEVPNIEDNSKKIKETVNYRRIPVKGVKGGVKGRRPYRPSVPILPPTTSSGDFGIRGFKHYYGLETTVASLITERSQHGIKSTERPLKTAMNQPITTSGPELASKVTIIPNSNPSTAEPLNPDVIITMRNEDSVSSTTENLVTKGVKKTKGSGEGIWGTRFGMKEARELFNDPKPEITTVESFTPEILNLPTIRAVNEVTEIVPTTVHVNPTTEAEYRQETILPKSYPTEQSLVQQTELPFQQTELPFYHTKIPVHPTKVPVHPTTIPSHQTDFPVQQTELPDQQTELPFYHTKSPVHPTKVPVHPTTIPPQQTELPFYHTKIPVHPTKVPVHPTTIPPQQTELPDQQTELPVFQQTENPVFQQTENPVFQQTENPVFQQTENPVFQQTENPIGQKADFPDVQVTQFPHTKIPEYTTKHRETEPTTVHIPKHVTDAPIQSTTQSADEDLQNTFEPQITQGPNVINTYIPQLTQKPEEDIQITQKVEIHTNRPTTVEIDWQNTQSPNWQQPTEIPQFTQHPDLPLVTTQLPTTTEHRKVTDGFYKYPLGLEGRHQIKGTKGIKGTKHHRNSSRVGRDDSQSGEDESSLEVVAPKVLSRGDTRCLL